MATEGAPDSTQLLKLFVGTLARVINPSVAQAALRAAATEAGMQGSVDALLQGPAFAEQAPPAAGKKGRQPKAEKKPQKPRKMQPYTIFVTKAMDKISKDANYQHLTAPGPDGKHVHPMSIAASLWKSLPEASREEFNKAYHPLCNQLKAEHEESGHKPDGLLQRVRSFEEKFDAGVKAKLRHVLPEHLPAGVITAAGGAAAVALPSGSEEEEEGESSEEEDSSSDEEEREAARQKEEAERKVREEAERKAAQEELEKKKKKEEKKARKSLGGKEEAKEDGDEDGKKKHKAKEHKDKEQGSAKKAKKA